MNTKTNFFLQVIFLVYITGNAQAPNRFSFQAVVRNAANSLVINQNVGVKISIESGFAPLNTINYSETHQATTNSNGLVTLQIGAGTPTRGTFENINWNSGQNKFIQCEIDPDGGTNYAITTKSQLLSVPFALTANYATTAAVAETVNAVPVKYYILSCGVFPSNNNVAADTIGSIVMHTGNFNADGCYLPCDGRSLAIAQNEAFFLVIGTTYGGDGITTFKIPNLNNGSLTKGN
jgi:hypothetical protein